MNDHINDQEKPEWYELLKQPLPGGGFPASRARETEEIAVGNIRRRSGLLRQWRLYSGVLAVVCLAITFAWFGSEGFQWTERGGNPTISYKPDVPGVPPVLMTSSQYRSQRYGFSITLPDSTSENLVIEESLTPMDIGIIRFLYQELHKNGTDTTGILFTIEIISKEAYPEMTSSDSLTIMGENELYYFGFRAAEQPFESRAFEQIYNQHREEILLVSESFVLEPAEIDESPYGLSIGSSYTVQGNFTVKGEPEGVSTLFSRSFQTEPGDTFVLEELSGSYARISAIDKEGWLPAWYLSERASLIETTEPYLMLVPEANTDLFKYPEDEDPDLFSLDPGRVVRVIAEYGDGEWLQIEFKLYDAAVWGDRWMKREDVAAYDPALAREGTILEGTILYNEDGSVKNEQNQTVYGIIYDVSIKSKDSGSFYSFSYPGGGWGLIRQEDFIPDPFY